MERVVISLKKEHNEIEKKLILLEELVGEILSENYKKIPEFKKLFNETIQMFPEHRDKEARLLEKLSKHEELREQIKEALFEHIHLDGHIKVIENALEKGNKEKIRLALKNDCRLMSSKIRDHIHKEEKIFDKAIFHEFAEISSR